MILLVHTTYISLILSTFWAWQLRYPEALPGTEPCSAAGGLGGTPSSTTVFGHNPTLPGGLYSGIIQLSPFYRDMRPQGQGPGGGG